MLNFMNGRGGVREMIADCGFLIGKRRVGGKAWDGRWTVDGSLLGRFEY
jgi:hypothetical protein